MTKPLKIFIPIALTLLVIIGVVSVLTNRGRQDRQIKIGVIAPLSGNAASYGEQVKKGIEIAHREIKSTGELNLQLVYEDNQFDPKLGLSAYRKLVDTDRVRYLITFGGNVCPVINPLAQKDGVINFATGCNTLPFTEAFSYNFRFDVSEAEVNKALMNHVSKTIKVQTLALLYINNEWGSIVAKTIKDALSENGIALVAEEKFNDDSGDVRSQIQKIKSQNPDAIFFLSLATFTPTLLKQLKESGVDAKLLTNISIEGGGASQFGDLTDGIVYSAPKLEQRENSRNKPFMDALPDPTSRNFASWGFDSLYLLADALKAKGNNPEEVAKFLHGTRDYPGAFGAITHNVSGELKLDYEIRTIQDGKFVKVSD